MTNPSQPATSGSSCHFERNQTPYPGLGGSDTVSVDLAQGSISLLPTHKHLNDKHYRTNDPTFNPGSLGRTPWDPTHPGTATIFGPAHVANPGSCRRLRSGSRFPKLSSFQKPGDSKMPTVTGFRPIGLAILFSQGFAPSAARL